MKLILTFILSSFITHAYTLGIYTDEPGGEKAQEVIRELQSTYPFNILDIEYRVIPQSSDDLDCGFRSSIARLPTCRSRKQRRHARRNDIDQALIIMDHERYGGSGGSIPVMTTNSPPTTMVHEYLHTLGLCDEYQYSADEADTYCPGMDRRENSAIISPEDSYSSDADARNEHRRDIMWYQDIASNTPITNGGSRSLNLGTGRVGNVSAPVNRTTEPTSVSSPIGLYRGTGCDNASRPIYLWHPGQERNIMERLGAGLGRANELIVKRLLIERGAQLKPDFDTVASPNTSSGSAEVINDDQQKVIDDLNATEDLIKQFKSKQGASGARKN